MRALLLLIIGFALPLSAQANESQRIITLGSAITETVFALGKGDQVVAVDTTSQYPEATHSLPDVGYLRTLGAEGVLSLQPDLIIASHEAGPPQVIEKLRLSGVRVEVIQTGPGEQEALAAIEKVGALIGTSDAAGQLVAENRTQLAKVSSTYAEGAKPRVLFILGGHGAQPIVSGNDTKANSMIELAMGENVATDFSSYKPANPEALVSMQPEVIVAASHGIARMGGLDKMLETSGLKHTPAAKHNRVFVMDTVYLLGMGPRMGAAASDLAAQIRAGSDNN